MSEQTFDAVVVAAGSGSRAGGAKQWRPLAGKPVARWSVEALLRAGARRVIVVIAPGGETQAGVVFSDLERVSLVEGGATRDRSVRNGLEALSSESDAPVLVHDAARPLLKPEHIRTLLAALDGVDGAMPALPVADTLKRGEDGLIADTVSREGLWRAQTPQAFRRSTLIAAYARFPEGEAPTDDAAVVERAGGRVRLIPGDPRLMKLTYPEDFAMAEALAGQTRRVRVGQGIDAHRWGPGEAVWLCGVRIDHDQTLIGHSDADAGLHALTDAVLGALGQGDIGDHFPPSDPQWKGASSDRFLAHAVALVRAVGGQVAHLDVTLICERPKIKPHREAMRARIAEIAGLALDAVSVKATTTEGMGFTGRGEGLLAQAVATIEL
ncbi:MAG: bifunctional 2-C-methyl-D-erythritol 4-phosphate cytidylyltransferase/2-C-methyl-D-erythritol 2,4-cyclodiphosphate synthase [Proteobacteria bacterium]|nr:bifunctional 2-C-methyl-D-erythritol 4-phosphate cytidylyltransferase/2-C-methyl-D-erythritol 2,4-cyclodiphosphate synthase [Pseudomonadota bacterium]